MRRDLVAINTAPDSENRMHGDEARRYGFSSGLVPGVDVLAYLAHEGVASWGTAWLARGRLEGRLIAPVYDGERVVVDSTEVDGVLTSQVCGAGGEVRAEARLSIPADADRGAVFARADVSGFAVALAPDRDERPPASATRLAPGTVLATQRATFVAARAPRYLDEISEDHEVFRHDGCAHPGWLLRFANWALSTTVRLGPWIHVSSDAWLLGVVHDGDEVEVRARVRDQYERKGHHFVDLEALYLVGGHSVAFVDHRAIWQPRTAD